MRWFASWWLAEHARRTSQERVPSTTRATLHVKRNLANPHLATSPTRRPFYEPTAGRLTTRLPSCTARTRCVAAIGGFLGGNGETRSMLATTCSNGAPRDRKSVV